MEPLEQFLTLLEKCWQQHSFIKLTLGKSATKSSTLKNIYARKVEIKGQDQVQLLSRYQTNDQTKNVSFQEFLSILKEQVGTAFLHVHLFTSLEDAELLYSKKRVPTLRIKKPSLQLAESIKNDKEKYKRVPLHAPFLFHLGVTTAQGELIPKMADKYRQINKYLEIFESLWLKSSQKATPTVVDMGSGKGYLTFALYDFLHNRLGVKATVIGVELRKDLVDYCNEVANLCGFEQLQFVDQRIEELDEATEIDVLIALHACDTATDDALAKGIHAHAEIIICAPCCHKQIRQQLKGVENPNPILKYGIFKERQFEMLTDTIRALILEQYQYKTKVFEFVSNEHTRKNVMLVGSKSQGSKSKEDIQQEINDLKNTYGVRSHYLETLL